MLPAKSGRELPPPRPSSSSLQENRVTHELPSRSLSFFYDRIAPLGLTSPFSISDLRQLTADVCAGRKSPAWSRFKGNKEAMAELSDRPEYCLDLTFMYSLLSLGYELDEERQIWMGKKVSDVELGWCVPLLPLVFLSLIHI